MASMITLSLFLIAFGNLASSFPLDSPVASAINNQRPASSSYIATKSFSDHEPNLNEDKINKANSTVDKYPPGVAENSFDYKLKQNSNNKEREESDTIESTEQPKDVSSNTPEEEEETKASQPQGQTEEQESLDENPTNPKSPEKKSFKVAGTMPRFGRAFGPIRPPPRTKAEKEPKSKPEEKLEDIPTPAARIALSQFPEQIVNNKAESSKIELRNVPEFRQYGPYPGAPYRGPPLPPPHYNEGLLFPDPRYRLPPLSQQKAVHPPIPYYNHIGLNDSITRVDFLLSYDVRSEGRGEPDGFGSQEKTQDGMIEGEYGFHVSNGGIRGVRYTADPNIHPQLLYDTLIKFLAL